MCAVIKERRKLSGSHFGKTAFQVPDCDGTSVRGVISRASVLICGFCAQGVRGVVSRCSWVWIGNNCSELLRGIKQLSGLLRLHASLRSVKSREMKLTVHDVQYASNFGPKLDS